MYVLSFYMNFKVSFLFSVAKKKEREEEEEVPKEAQTTPDKVCKKHTRFVSLSLSHSHSLLSQNADRQTYRFIWQRR